jgi:hypothetical protein
MTEGNNPQPVWMEGWERIAEAERLATLEAALRTIQSAIPNYLKGEMSEHDFALLVLGAADSAMVNKALEGGR